MHFLKTNLSIVNRLISGVKIMYKEKSYHLTFNAINTMMIYPSACCSWFLYICILDIEYTALKYTHI